MKNQLFHTVARFSSNPNAAKIVAVVMLLSLATMALVLPGAVVLADIPMPGGG
ncbi:MAG TPA: hypothetical protein VK003_14600 [Oceanobacillus sp.]|nr:hypothetical protein [Oceanobacillus sp.]